MISLLKNKDAAGKEYSPSEVIALLDSGIKISAAADYGEEAIVWLPQELRPQVYELKRMCACPIEDEDIGQCLLWPVKELYDNYEERFCGFVAKRPKITGKLTSLNDVIQERKTLTELSDTRKRILAGIGLKLAMYFEAVHSTQNKYVFGSVSPSDFYLDEAGCLFCFTAFQCTGSRFGCGNPYYMAPELIEMMPRKVLYNELSDSFIYSLILFQLFTGKYPYAPEYDLYEKDYKEIWAFMSDGQSVYFEENSKECIAVNEALRAFSWEIAETFRLVFDFCGRSSYVQGRPKIGEWIHVLQDYLLNR